MSFGKNLRFLMRLRGEMPEAALAEALGVSPETVADWLRDAAAPDAQTAGRLCGLFNCGEDELLRGDIDLWCEAFDAPDAVELAEFRYFCYTVISPEPEDDSLRRVRDIAEMLGIEQPDVVGWDFPFVSKEQTERFGLRGYTAACILPEGRDCARMRTQPASRYMHIRIRDPFSDPFELIPKAYHTVFRYMRVNGLDVREEEGFVSCFERSYERDGTTLMDVFIAVG